MTVSNDMIHKINQELFDLKKNEENLISTLS